MAAFEKELRKRHDRMKLDRANHEQRWDDNGILFSPNRGDVTTKTSEGSQRIKTVLDTTGITAMDVMINFLHGQLFGIGWVYVSPFIVEDIENDDLRFEAQRVGQITTRRLLEAFDKSNFSQESFAFLRDLLTYGTALMRRAKDDRWHFRAAFPGSVWIRESADDEIDIVHVAKEMTGEQALVKFGDKIPESLRRKIDGDPDDKIEFVHCVFPRRESIPWTMQAGSKDRNWASVIMTAEEVEGSSGIVENEGLRTNPFTASRWDKVDGHIWGYSPADQAAADMKSLNMMASEELKAAAMDLRPPLLAHESIFRSNIRPGRKVAVKPAVAGSPLTAEYLRSQSNFAAAFTIKEAMQQRVKIALLGDVLGERDTEPRSAAETFARQRRAFSRLAGPANRLEKEFLTPTIVGLVKEMREAGELPELEDFFDEVGGAAKVDITYRSPLLIAQREASLQPLLQTLSEMSTLATNTQNPSWIEPFDVDGIHALIREARNVPAEAYIEPEQLRALRAQRQEAQQLAQGVELAKGVSETARNLGGNGAIAQ